MKLAKKLVSIVASVALAGCMIAVAPAVEQVVTQDQGTTYTAEAASTTKATIYVGEKVQPYLTLNGKRIKGTKVKWKSSNTKVATISKSGIVTGKKAGKVTITGTYKGKNHKWTITVKAKTALVWRSELKNDLKKNGTRDGVRYYFSYTMSDGDYVKVSYNSEKNYFAFYWEASSGINSLFILPAGTNTSSFEPSIYFPTSSGEEVEVYATVVIKDYCFDELDWYYTSGAYDDESHDDSLIFNEAMDDWGKLLAGYGYQMKDLGFSSIGVWK